MGNYHSCTAVSPKTSEQSRSEKEWRKTRETLGGAQIYYDTVKNEGGGGDCFSTALNPGQITCVEMNFEVY